jgi:hypothetical protein
MRRSGAVVAALFVSIGSVSLSRPAAADDDSVRVLPCRPTISCSADIVPPGAAEIEAGYAARRVSEGGYVETEPVLLKLTLLRWLQLQAGSSALVYSVGDVPRRLDYVDDLSFGGKVHLVDQTPATPSFAVSATVNVPSFDPDAAAPGGEGASFWAYASKDFGAPGSPGSLHVDLNGGADVLQLDLPARRARPFVALALTESLPLKLCAMTEAYAFGDGGPLAPHDAGVLAAMGYAPKPSVMFDAGADVSAFPATRTWTLFAGVTFVPARLWGGPRTTPVTARSSAPPSR